MNDDTATIRPPRWLMPLPIFLSEQAFNTLKAAYEMDEQDADLSFSTDAARFKIRAKGMPDWYREIAHVKHPLGQHPRAQGSRGFSNHDWGWRELFDAGLLVESGWFAYAITPNGRHVYESIANRVTEYVAV